jgi:riboflavin kinase / FMN adenylyltransferase
METILGHDKLNPAKPTVAAIGTFDGVHRGHQRIIRAVKDRAQSAGLPTLLLTFDVHPRQVLSPQAPAETLTTLKQKLALLETFGLDYVCVLSFKEVMGLSAEEFCRDVLVNRGNVAHLFVGANFRFGAGAAGDVGLLERCGAGKFGVTGVDLETIDRTVVSSTEIRNLLKNGQVEKIAPLLGRRISLAGRVVRGAGRGAGLGFPTANLEFEPGLCRPQTGVYIGYLSVRELKLPAIINCGSKPTFEAEGYQCEAHILDYHADIYGEAVELELAVRLRDEEKFPSPEALSRRITDDLHHAREWFAANASR